MILSIFFTASSIASLADYVFAWKGFILDGIHFYRAYVTNPISKVASFLKLEIVGYERDLVVLTIILTVAHIRFVRALFDSSSKYDPDIPTLGKTGTSVLTAALGLVLIYNIGWDPGDHEHQLLNSLMAFAIFLLIICLGYKALRHKTLRIYYAGPIVVSIISVLNL